MQKIEQTEGREALENRLKETYYGELLQIHLRAKPETYQGERGPKMHDIGRFEALEALV